MKKTKTVIKHFQEYLDHVEDLSRDLDTEQDEQLANILSVQLALLVALKKTSRLGEPNFDHLFRKTEKKSPRNQQSHYEDEDD